MNVIHIQIYHNRVKYDEYAVSSSELNHCDNCHRGPTRGKIRLARDGTFLHYFIKELLLSESYRLSFLKLLSSRAPKNVNTIRFDLIGVEKELIDYRWNERLYYLVMERCELEHALSWLSTLGGAFSALGDYMDQCARIAGQISLNQFKLAIRLNDPDVMARCRLYASLSLIQRQRFQLAKEIVWREYRAATNAHRCDEKLVRMCKGIWAKLQYEHGRHRDQRQRRRRRP